MPPSWSRPHDGDDVALREFALRTAHQNDMPSAITNGDAVLLGDAERLEFCSIACSIVMFWFLRV